MVCLVIQKKSQVESLIGIDRNLDCMEVVKTYFKIEN